MSRAEIFPPDTKPGPETDAQAWVGRSETHVGATTPNLAGMLGAALGHAASTDHDLTIGAALPPLWHWIAFPEFVPLSGLGQDGHPALGGFLPPLNYARRMWAGGRLAFHGTLRVGEAITRRSEILSIKEKEGATGSMVFVKVGHDLRGELGGVIREEQDIVYLHIPEEFTPPKKVPAPDTPVFDETVPMNEARLFRFSAATYNAHRIHYDLRYTRDVEKYPDLVVHGPMQAMLLMEAAMRHTGARPTRFRFRGIHPMLLDGDMRLMASRVPGEAAIDLCTVAAAGHQGLQASMEWV